MNQFYLMGGIICFVAFLILCLWVRNKILAAKVKKLKVAVDQAETVIEHNDAVANVVKERNEKREERIKEKVNEAVDNEFDDFYN